MNVKTRLDDIQKERTPGFWVMISIIVGALVLSFIGIIVQYTKVGNLTDKKI